MGVTMVISQLASPRGISTEILLGLICIESEIGLHGSGWGLKLTSITDGKHMKGSLHYVGLAADFVLIDGEGRLLINQAKYLHELRGSIGREYDLLFHDGHFHLEYQPKTP